VLKISGKKGKEVELNEDIRDKEVRVIGEDGSPIGIMSSEEAFKLAQEQDFDLVKIAPQAVPPVVKIMDYGKYRFEQQKKEKEAKKNQKIVELKEIRLSLNIDTHDFNTKLGHAEKFLAAGNKVKVSIRFRGREMAHANLGTDVMNRFADAVQNGTVESVPKLEGRSMTMLVAPNAQK
jgi:translation initiation factor IF-3